MLQFIWALCFVVVFSMIINRSSFFYHRRVHPLLFQAAFLLKVLTGALLTLIYTYIYTDRSTADIFKYFDDSKIMFDALPAAPYDFFRMFSGYHSGDADLFKYYSKMIAWDDSDLVYNDNRIIIRYNCLLRFISFGNYYVHMVVMCFITFYGLTCLFKLFASEVREKYTALFFAVFLMPSVLFWGSAVLKDAAILFATGIFLYNYNLLLNNSAMLFNKLLLLVGLALMILIKVYVFSLMLPGLILLLLIKRKPGWKLNHWIWWLSIYFLFGVLLYFQKFISGINIVEQIAIKQHQFMSLALSVGSGSMLQMPEIHNLQSVLLAIPSALYATFFQPCFFCSSSPLIIIAGLENLMILLSVVFALVYSKRSNVKLTPWFYFGLFFTVLLYVLIGLIVPVAGALVRYKTIALPFLIFVLAVITDKEKVKPLLIKWKLRF